MFIKRYARRLIRLTSSPFSRKKFEGVNLSEKVSWKINKKIERNRRLKFVITRHNSDKEETEWEEETSEDWGKVLVVICAFFFN